MNVIMEKYVEMEKQKKHVSYCKMLLVSFIIDQYLFILNPCCSSIIPINSHFLFLFYLKCNALLLNEHYLPVKN